MLPQAFAHPNSELPAQLGAMTAARHAVTHHHTFGHLSSKMGQVTEKLGALEQHVAHIPKEQIYTDEASNLVREDAVTGSKVAYVKVS